MSDYSTDLDNKAAEEKYWRAERMNTPSFMLKPRLSIDGDQWCALHGENLQDGIAGFGDSPDKAYLDFDKNWTMKLSEALK